MCPNCQSFNVVKDGKRRNIQRYQCQVCKHNFSSKRRPGKLIDKLFKEYFFGKQTLNQLSIKYSVSIPYIKKLLDAYQPQVIKVNPKVVTVIADATFFGRRKHGFGTLVFKDDLTKTIIASKHIDSETVADYKQLAKELQAQGYKVQAVVIDGKRGLIKAFMAIPVQICHFHQIATIKRYLTNNLKLTASIKLLAISNRLTTTNELKFKTALDSWHYRHKDFLGEKSLNIKSSKLTPTHTKLLSAYKSLTINLPYLFTYKNYKELKIPNTTNSLDGGVFSHLKKLVKLHQGLAMKRKVKLIDEFLSRHNEKL